MAEAAFAFSVISAGAKVFGAINKADSIREEAAANAKAHEYNAAQQNKAAIDTLVEGSQNELRFKAMTRRFLGHQTSQYAASGVAVDQGSALDVLQSSSAMAEMDALTIRENASNKSSALSREAAFSKKKAKYALESGERMASAALWEGVAGGITSTAPLVGNYDF